MNDLYYPYFRGKQYELVTVRENAKLLADSSFVPIIEPVKEKLNGLGRTLDAIDEAGGKSIIIVNPHCGDLVDGVDMIIEFLQENSYGGSKHSPAILLKENTSIKEIRRLYEKLQDEDLTLIHSGSTNREGLLEILGDNVKQCRHVFLESCGRLYRNNFPGKKRIFLCDGFVQRRNKDHPEVESFSDIHVTYKEEGMAGFGDFLIVGDEYSETGGPAYAIAIHLTYIDEAQDNEMFICHFLSERQNTPVDPAGKFAEALDVMIDFLERAKYPILKTEAVKEFRQLHEDGHFPGLGYVKKLSMKHHLETLSNFLGD